MKALSLWQPHALAIGVGLKPWETRDWPTSYRGPLAIHASKRPWKERELWDNLALRLFRERLYPSLPAVDHNPEAISALLNRDLVYGAVVCVCDVVDCQPTSTLRHILPARTLFWGNFTDGDQGRGRFAFKLANVRRLRTPFYVRGMQGFFDVNLPADATQRSLLHDL
jgi:activating signal cointegrator 1